MPGLPRIRTGRSRAIVRSPEPDAARITEVQGDGPTWIHWGKPTHEEAQQLAARFDWHPRDTLEALRTYVAFDLDGAADDSRLVSVDRHIAPSTRCGSRARRPTSGSVSETR